MKLKLVPKKVNYLSFLILLAGIMFISGCVKENNGINVNDSNGEDSGITVSMVQNQTLVMKTVASRAMLDPNAKPDIELKSKTNSNTIFAFVPNKEGAKATLALDYGTLPEGIQLDPGGSIRGIPQAAGASNFGVCLKYDDGSTRDCSIVNLIVDEADLDEDGEGCCVPACTITNKSQCSGRPGYSFFEDKQCKKVDPCKIGCCTPGCNLGQKSRCEMNNLVWHDMPCEDVDLCKKGCCMPSCNTKTLEDCRKIPGAELWADQCGILDECEIGCCTPSCEENIKSQCEAVDAEGKKLGTWHEMGCEKREACQKGCCVPQCTDTEMGKCLKGLEDPNVIFYNKTCAKVPECSGGCCLPLCEKMTQKECEAVPDEFTFFGSEDCMDLKDCDLGCCTPSCSLKEKSVCQAAKGQWHDVFCDKITSCTRDGLWEGIYTDHSVFNGVWTCITDTANTKIQMCLDQSGLDLTGYIMFPEGFNANTVATEEGGFCPPAAHCSGGKGGYCSEIVAKTVSEKIGSGGKVEITGLTLNGGFYGVCDPKIFTLGCGDVGQSSGTFDKNDTLTVIFSSSGASGATTSSSISGSFKVRKISDTCPPLS